jgi:hypothetical protein
MTRENSSIATLKVWIFPSLVSLISLLIWNDVNEIKADVKLLMAQSNIDKTRIDNLERQIYKSNTLAFPGVPVKDQEPKPNEYAVLVDNRTKFIR